MPSERKLRDICMNVALRRAQSEFTESSYCWLLTFLKKFKLKRKWLFSLILWSLVLTPFKKIALGQFQVNDGLSLNNRSFGDKGWVLEAVWTQQDCLLCLLNEVWNWTRSFLLFFELLLESPFQITVGSRCKDLTLFFVLDQFRFPYIEHLLVWLFWKFVSHSEMRAIKLAKGLSYSNAQGLFNDARAGLFAFTAGWNGISMTKLSSVISTPRVTVALNCKSNRVVWSCSKPTYNFFSKVTHFFWRWEWFILFKSETKLSVLIVSPRINRAFCGQSYTMFASASNKADLTALEVFACERHHWHRELVVVWSCCRDSALSWWIQTPSPQFTFLVNYCTMLLTSCHKCNWVAAKLTNWDHWKLILVIVKVSAEIKLIRDITVNVEFSFASWEYFSLQIQKKSKVFATVSLRNELWASW